jgi:capsular exopolysaccharide synthesis family protein
METSHKPTGGTESKLHFLDYWRIIRIRKTIILAVFFLVVITTIAVTFYLPVSYSSTVRIKVEKDTPDIGLFGSIGLPQQTYDPYYLLTEFEVIQSKKVLYPVIEDLGLNKDYAKRYKAENEFSAADSYEILSKEIDVKQFRNTSIIEIRAFNPSAQVAADIANKIATQYQQYRDELRVKRAKGGQSTLSNNIVEMETAVSQARDVVDRLRKELKVTELIDSSDGLPLTLDQDTMRRLGQTRDEAEIRLLANQKLLEKIRGKAGTELRTLLSVAAPTAELTSLLGKLNDAEATMASFSPDLGQNHPQVKRVTTLIEKLNQQLDEQVQGILLGREAMLAADQTTVNSISNKLAEAIQKDTQMAEKYRPYIQAKRDYTDQQRLRTVLLSKKWQEKIDAEISKSASVEIIQNAEPARRPVKPNKPLNIALGIMVGLMVGVGLAFFIEYLDTSVKTIDDVEQSLQSPVLGVIPQNVGALIHEGPDSPHAEAYRVLRTNVLFSRKDPNLRTMTVVSGGAGEGKSTTIFNLATVFAQQGNRVLVVDSDLRRPSLHKLLNVTNSIGLTNYLLKQNKLEEVIQTTAIPTMDFLPSGKLPSSSMGILNSVQMKEFIEEVKRRYDFVFFDSPPIMGVSDASILASEVDMAILVVQYRKYPQQMTLRAKQMVEKVGGRLLGVVLNNINISQDSYYYYYSGYYYDYYSKSEDAKTSGEKKGKAATGEKAALDIKQKY